MDAFAQALAVEEQNPLAALPLYKPLAESGNTAAHINMGTIFYNVKNYTEAEAHYRAALAIDPQYALAYFDLANLLDDLGQPTNAEAMYLRAIQLAPTYADAHYNLAVLYTSQRCQILALKHWRAYLKLDPRGAWGDYAKISVSRIVQATGLLIVRRNEKPKRTTRRAKLELLLSGRSNGS